MNISREDLEEMFVHIDNKHRTQFRMLLFLYWALPIAASRLIKTKACSISKEKEEVIIKFEHVYVRMDYNDDLVFELYDYASKLPPNMFLFWFYNTKTPKNAEERTKAFIKKMYKKIGKEVTSRDLKNHATFRAVNSLPLCDASLLCGQDPHSLVAYMDMPRRKTIRLPPQYFYDEQKDKHTDTEQPTQINQIK